jgi:transcriptional antiterminator RfaH
LPSTQSNWAVAVTSPQGELRAAKGLRDDGFEFFFPRIKRRVRHRGKRVARLDPLFPNYIFVLLAHAWFEMNEIINRISNTTHIHCLIQNDEKVSTIPHTTIQEIKSRCDADGVFTPPPKPKFVAGEGVRIASGQFYGFSGLVEEVLKNERAVVSLRTLGKVNVAVADLLAG